MDVTKLSSEQRATLASVTASFMLDSQRWLDSYTAHTATQLRRRALAAGNGKP